MTMGVPVIGIRQGAIADVVWPNSGVWIVPNGLEEGFGGLHGSGEGVKWAMPRAPCC